jgi:predicted GNAT family N-acyltransferase
MRIDYLQRKDLKKIERLLVDYKFNDYRNHRIFSKEQRINYVLGEISDSIDKGDYVFVTKDKDDILGLASLINLPWDTKHFGFKMAKIGHLIVNESYNKSFKIKNILLSFILQLCKKEAINHVSCRIETDDFSSNHCLEQKGFMIMDTLVTYLLYINTVSLILKAYIG